MSGPGPTRVLGALPAIVLATVAIGELWSVARYDDAVPTEDDWRAASEAISARYRDGELLVVAPEWLDPVLRLHLGDFIDIDTAARMDAARYPVIWELSARGQRAPEVEGLEPSQTWTFGELELARYEQQAAELVHDLVAALPDARPEGEFAAPARVSVEEVEFRPRRCIVIEAKAGAGAALRFPAATEGGTLVGFVGLADVFTRRDLRAPAEVTIAVDGKAAAAVVAGVDDGWQRFETEVPAGAEIRVEVRSPQPKRLVCFAAEVRK